MMNELHAEVLAVENDIHADSTVAIVNNLNP